jgi:hypothetical protein
MAGINVLQFLKVAVGSYACAPALLLSKPRFLILTRTMGNRRTACGWFQGCHESLESKQCFFMVSYWQGGWGTP